MGLLGRLEACGIMGYGTNRRSGRASGGICAILRGCLHGAGRLSGVLLADTQIYKHPKRPEWGFAVFNDEVEDRVRFAFSDNQIRAFRADSLHMLTVVDLPEPEATKVRAELSRKRTVTAAGLPKKKPKPRAPKVAAAPKK